MSKDKFLSFARVHPELAKEVISGKVSWQQLYEIYEIYGEKHTIWNDYLKNDFDFNTIKDFFEMVKKIDLNHVQNGIENIQKTISLLQDMGNHRNGRTL